MSRARPTPDTELAFKFKDIEKRLSILERTSPLGNSSIREGRLRVLDNESNERVRLGRIDDDDTAAGYGIVVSDDSTAAFRERLQIDGGGWRYPYLTGQAIDPTTPGHAITTGTYTTTWWWITPFTTHQAVGLFVPVTSGSGTTGDVRLTVSGGATSDPVAIPADTAGYAEFRWLHGAPLAVGPVTVLVDARRTAGADLYVGAPFGGLRGPHNCTTAGAVGIV